MRDHAPQGRRLGLRENYGCIPHVTGSVSVSERLNLHSLALAATKFHRIHGHR